MKEVLENKTCKLCAQNFPIYQEDQDFYDKISPSFAGKKFQIPRPTLCPECRQQRRLAINNERNLYKRVCDATGREIISIYSPDKDYIVYDQDFWWSENWELEMNREDFNFWESFFSQFYTLSKKVPKRALVKWTGSENCAYTNCIGASKNCYLTFNGMKNEDCLYVDSLSDAQDCVDCSEIRHSSQCYECSEVIECHSCTYVSQSKSCTDSSYLLNCENCDACFACVNLRNKKYHIFNVEYSKEEYLEKKEALINNRYSSQEFYEFSLEYPRQWLRISWSEKVSGNMIYNSKNIFQGFEIYNAEDIRYSSNIYNGAHDCMDAFVCLNNSNKLYEMSLANKNCSNLLFCHDCWNNCNNLLYCSECKLTSDCFGCTGLVKRQYCILNKQYTKDEYEMLVPKIITYMQQTWEWGEFFPINISPFGYNETLAHEHYPLSKKEIIEISGKWSDYIPTQSKADKIIQAQKLPHDIADIPDDILTWAIECELTKKPFRIIASELLFYRKHHLPIPRKHPNSRYVERKSLRNMRKIFARNCDSCEAEMETTYSPERLEKVFCIDCYNKEIYG